MKKLILGLTLLFVAASASAQPFVWPSAWSNSTPSAAVTGGTLRSSMISDPRTFNPITSAESQALSDHIFAGGLLIQRGPDSDAWVAYAAESFTPNEEGTVVDVVLREGILWSDGEPVTVQDYYTTYLLETDPDIGANGHDSWFMDGDPIVLEITGERSLRFSFPRPDRLAFPVVSMSPTRDSIFGEAYRSGGAEAVQALWGTDVDLSTTVWTSAFIPVSYTPGERVVLQANPTYGQWNVDEAGNGLPYLAGYNLTIVTDLDAALNLYLAGELDNFSPRNLDDIGTINVAINNGDIDAQVMEAVSPVASSQFIVWNWNMASNPAKEALFRNVNFRRAMAHLLDRDALIELVYNGSAMPMFTNVYPINEFWVNPDVEKYPFDPELAAQLLADIGYANRGSDGILTNSAGHKLSFTLATNAGNTAREQITQIFADSAREIGVDVQVQAIDFNLLVEQLLSEGTDRPFDAILIGLTGGSRDWPFGVNVIPCGTNLHMFNTSGDCISPLETLMGALFTQGRETLDTEAARLVGNDLQQVESELIPILYTVSPMAHYSWLNTINGYHQEGQINPLLGAWELSLLYKTE